MTNIDKIHYVVANPFTELINIQTQEIGYVVSLTQTNAYYVKGPPQLEIEIRWRSNRSEICTSLDHVYIAVFSRVQTTAEIKPVP